MRKWYPWIITALTAVFTLAVWSRLPERMPTHWNAAGEVDGWSSRAFGAWLMPAIVAVMSLLLPWIPRIDPRRENYERFMPTYLLAINAIITTMAALQVVMLGAALGWPVRMERVAPIGVGALFILLGNVMPRARPNWFFGIRTPWTLSSDRVWERTHRLGGVIFIVAGVLVMGAAFAPKPMVFPIFMTAVMTASIIPLVYSYIVWRKEVPR